MFIPWTFNSSMVWRKGRVSLPRLERIVWPGSRIPCENHPPADILVMDSFREMDYALGTDMNEDQAHWNHWVPNADVYLADGKLVVKVELAGLTHQNVELSIDGTRLLIRGERPDGSRSSPCKFNASEIHYGAFQCAVEIPAGFAIAHALATYRNGFLRIDVPSHVDVNHNGPSGAKGDAG